MDFQRINLDFEIGSVEESLFIPLIVKAKETQRSDCIFTDLKSVEILERVNIEMARFDGGGIAQHGILVRTTIIDSIVDNFIKINPECTILNLGAGLDTRIERIDNGKIHWYDVDFPKVIELRRKFFKDSDRIRFVPGSILDSEWVNEINLQRDEPILIIAEGLLMYFTENEVKSIFNLLINSFPNAEMCFDLVHNFFVGKGISSKFRWGIKNAKEIERINDRIKLIKQWSVGDYHKKRQELFFRIMNVLPSTRNRSQILHIKLMS